MPRLLWGFSFFPHILCLINRSGRLTSLTLHSLVMDSIITVLFISPFTFLICLHELRTYLFVFLLRHTCSPPERFLNQLRGNSYGKLSTLEQCRESEVLLYNGWRRKGLLRALHWAETSRWTYFGVCLTFPKFYDLFAAFERDSTGFSYLFVCLLLSLCVCVCSFIVVIWICVCLSDNDITRL